MKKCLVIIVLVASLASSSGAADKPRTYGPKSPGTAATLSIFGTILPYTVLFASIGNESGDAGAGMIVLFGTIFGPGVGHAYAGNSGQFWLGAGVRTLGWGGMLVAVGLSWDNGNSNTADAAIIGSMGLIVISSIWDMTTAAGSARKYNKKHGLSLSPKYDHKSKTTGLQLALSF